MLRAPPRDGDALSNLDDPWRYCVLAPEVSGFFEQQSNYRHWSLSPILTIRRITSTDKLIVRGLYERYFTAYRLEDGTLARGSVQAVRGNALYARSIGRQWALGLLAAAAYDEFTNLAHQARGAPVVEWNAFPYEENARRQLRFAYQAGLWENAYIEPSIFGYRRELRPFHSLSTIVDVNQPWGSIQVAIQARSFLDAPRKYRAGGRVVLALRLVEGLALKVEASAARVEDQISLRRRPLADEELLLGTQQLPTEFSYSITYGLSYTFGSIHNTIVNPRFGDVDVLDQ
jgi:hypothetical protein